MSKQIKKHIRTLKIYTHYSPRARSEDYPVPYIRLQGKWLEQAGFYSREKIQVIVKKGKLVIFIE